MERIPNVKITGDISEAYKEDIFNMYKEKFDNHSCKSLETLLPGLHENEIEKTPEVRAYIDAANSETNKILIDLGIEPYDIQYDHVHIVKEDFDSLPALKAGGYMASLGGLLIRDVSSSIAMAATILHEMLHMKGIYAQHVVETMKIDPKDESRRKIVHTVSNRRSGISVIKNDTNDVRDYYDSMFFGGLHEAIVKTQEKRSMAAMLFIPVLSAEKERNDSFLAIEENRLQVAGMLLKSRGNIDFSEIIDITQHVDGHEERLDVKMYSYYGVRKTLQYVCEELQQSFPEIYPTTDDVFKEFLRAQFSGELLTLGSLMKSTFGPTGFRVLGEMDPTDESAKECLEKLTALRL